jgi:opacity protein-like surface antigen
MKFDLIKGFMLAGLVSVTVFAEQGVPAGEFYVNPGVALTGAGANGYKNSFSLDAAYLKAIHQIAAIGWEAGYLFGSKLDGTDTSLKILHVSPEIKVGPTFPVQGLMVNTFVLGGGGLYWGHQNSGTATLPTGQTVAFDSVDRVNGGWNIGLGAEVNLPGNWSLGLEFRRHELVNKHTTDFTWMTPALRFALLFS